MRKGWVSMSFYFQHIRPHFFGSSPMSFSFILSSFILNSSLLQAKAIPMFAPACTSKGNVTFLAFHSYYWALEVLQVSVFEPFLPTLLPFDDLFSRDHLFWWLSLAEVVLVPCAYMNQILLFNEKKKLNKLTSEPVWGCVLFTILQPQVGRWLSVEFGNKVA